MAAAAASFLNIMKCPLHIRARRRLSADRLCNPSHGPAPAWSGLLLLRVVLLFEHVGAFFQRIFQLGLRDEQHVVRKQLLARQTLLDFLDPFGILVVLAERAGGAEADRIVLALELADPDGIGQAVERGGLDHHRLLERRALRRHVGELERAERVRGRVRPGDLELFVGPRAAETPVGVVAGALDAVAAPFGIAHLERLDLLHLERGLVDPVRAPGAGLGERVGDDIDHLRLARQRDEAAVGARLVGVVDLALEILLTHDQLRERLTVGTAEFHLRSAFVEVEPRAILVADRLALPHPERKGLHHENPHLPHVRRKISALGEHPALVLLPHGQRGFRLDDADGGDLGGLEVLEEGAAEHVAVHGALAALLVLVEQRAAAEDDQQHHENCGEARVHTAFLLLPPTNATSRPMSATSNGISTMLATLVQNTRLSASWRRFLRTSLSCSRASATVLRKRSSSACCSGERSCADLPAGPCDFCSSCSLAVVFCTSSSSAWILPKYCFCASASSSRTTVSGLNAPVRLRSEMKSSPAANCSTMPMANAGLPFDGTTTLRPKTSWTSTAAPSARRSTSATRMTAFSFADSRSCGVLGTGLSPSFKPSGNAVLNLPVSLSASGIDLPEGLKALVASSPDLVAFALSTSMALGELFTSSAMRIPSCGFTSKAPPNA